jgi:sulfoxide reductase catalytic subunit YedY
MNTLRNPGFVHPVPSEITPKSFYLKRRTWLQTLAAGGSALGAWAARDARAASVTRPGKLAPLAAVPSSVAGALTMEKLTGYEHVTGYNNFYEFGT